MGKYRSVVCLAIIKVWVIFLNTVLVLRKAQKQNICFYKRCKDSSFNSIPCVLLSAVSVVCLTRYEYHLPACFH